MKSQIKTTHLLKIQDNPGYSRGFKINSRKSRTFQGSPFFKDIIVITGPHESTMKQKLIFFTNISENVLQ
jgi:hypothetical protein